MVFFFFKAGVKALMGVCVCRQGGVAVPSVTPVVGRLGGGGKWLTQR